MHITFNLFSVKRLRQRCKKHLHFLHPDILGVLCSLFVLMKLEEIFWGNLATLAASFGQLFFFFKLHLKEKHFILSWNRQAFKKTPPLHTHTRIFHLLSIFVFLFLIHLGFKLNDVSDYIPNVHLPVYLEEMSQGSTHPVQHFMKGIHHLRATAWLTVLHGV